MTDCIRQSDLQPYLDGELGRDRSDSVLRHIEVCADCSRDLRQLRNLSTMLAEESSHDMTDDELRRLHVSVDRWAAEAGPRTLPFRWIRAFAAMAASILVIASAWMIEMPASSPHGVGTTLASTQDWERIAVTLQVDPPPPGLGEPGLAEANFADWFLENLDERGHGTN